MARQIKADFGRYPDFPCKICVSPGRDPWIHPANRLAFEIFRRTSGQAIFVGGGLAPLVPIDISIPAVTTVMDLIGVRKRRRLELIDKVRELFFLTQRKDLLDIAEIKREARENGAEGPLEV